MNAPLWVTLEECLAFHSMLATQFGGSDSVRDEGKLFAALERPKQQYYHYEQRTILELSATYLSGIAKSNPFIDGNKQTGLIASQIFIETNGYRSNASEKEAALQVLALADSHLDDEELTLWQEVNTRAT